MNKQKIKVGITIGDANGVGPELVIKALSDIRILDLCIPVIYGSAKALVHYKRVVSGSEEFQFVVIDSARQAKEGQMNLVGVKGEEPNVEMGEVREEMHIIAVAGMKKAIEDAVKGDIDVVVMAPLRRERGEGEKVVGELEYIEELFEREPIMMMCSDLLKVGVVTRHLPLAEVSERIKKNRLVELLERGKKLLVEDFGVVAPRIAVLALNPETPGKEEKEEIQPAIKQANDRDILAFGPFYADDFFAEGRYRKYDLVLAMYYDQGVIPFKTLTASGVEYAAGLPVVITASKSGVCYDMAGKNEMDGALIREAIYTAIDIYRSRKTYAEITKNPLGFNERERTTKDLSVDDLLLPEPENDI